MHFKEEIQKAVYELYLNSIDITSIAAFLDMKVEDVNEIIDYLNSFL